MWFKNNYSAETQSAGRAYRFMADTGEPYVIMCPQAENRAVDWV